jgi:hypothetical protein
MAPQSTGQLSDDLIVAEIDIVLRVERRGGDTSWLLRCHGGVMDDYATYSPKPCRWSLELSFTGSGARFARFARETFLSLRTYSDVRLAPKKQAFARLGSPYADDPDWRSRGTNPMRAETVFVCPKSWDSRTTC